MSTQPGYADRDPDPRDSEDPTLKWTAPVSDAATEQMPAAERPPVAPPPQLRPEQTEPPAPTEQHVTPALLAVSSDRCANCGSQLAPDQHYCVVCGERRGRQRFAGAMFGASAMSAPASAMTEVTHGAAVRGSRVPPSTTVVAFIATLLIAIGLGVLIGHDSASNKQIAAKQQPVNVTVNGGGGLGSGSSSGTSSTAGSGSSSSSSSTSAATKAPSKQAASKGTQAAVTKGAQAAKSVLGGGSVKTAPPTVSQGSSCTAGTAGCQGGKFTGNFFGG